MLHPRAFLHHSGSAGFMKSSGQVTLKSKGLVNP